MTKPNSDWQDKSPPHPTREAQLPANQAVFTHTDSQRALSLLVAPFPSVNQTGQSNNCPSALAEETLPKNPSMCDWSFELPSQQQRGRCRPCSRL
ncbi:hypothetical protein MJO28_000555 [Puccinia striiformis f. sp. tritici]|uniref:Uncharacterized protein n=1 Tax=Puccinia striiformis f. sp. tritici TaxID=168172 RepID=A0ACC0EYW2_9BASI|nr:hypothetical protein MJO28_000555 [Puccinia striiformis f. sp. tritici]